MEQNFEIECVHETASERALVGTWVVDEVRLAVQKGYQLIKVFEVYQYEITQHDSKTGERGPFAE